MRPGSLWVIAGFLVVILFGHFPPAQAQWRMEADAGTIEYRYKEGNTIWYLPAIVDAARADIEIEPCTAEGLAPDPSSSHARAGRKEEPSRSSPEGESSDFSWRVENTKCVFTPPWFEDYLRECFKVLDEARTLPPHSKYGPILAKRLEKIKKRYESRCPRGSELWAHSGLLGPLSTARCEMDACPEGWSLVDGGKKCVRRLKCAPPTFPTLLANAAALGNIPLFTGCGSDGHCMAKVLNRQLQNECGTCDHGGTPHRRKDSQLLRGGVSVMLDLCRVEEHDYRFAEPPLHTATEKVVPPKVAETEIRDSEPDNGFAAAFDEAFKSAEPAPHAPTEKVVLPKVAGTEKEDTESDNGFAAAFDDAFKSEGVGAGVNASTPKVASFTTRGETDKRGGRLIAKGLQPHIVEGDGKGAQSSSVRFLWNSRREYVLDQKTQLEWYEGNATGWIHGEKKARNWLDAGADCLGLGGEWRLPEDQELMTLIDNNARGPLSLLPNISATGYWTSSRTSEEGAKLVDFREGKVYPENVFEEMRVRCVRTSVMADGRQSKGASNELLTLRKSFEAAPVKVGQLFDRRNPCPQGFRVKSKDETSGAPFYAHYTCAATEPNGYFRGVTVHALGARVLIVDLDVTDRYVFRAATPEELSEYAKDYGQRFRKTGAFLNMAFQITPAVRAVPHASEVMDKGTGVVRDEVDGVSFASVLMLAKFYADSKQFCAMGGSAPQIFSALDGVVACVRDITRTGRVAVAGVTVETWDGYESLADMAIRVSTSKAMPALAGIVNEMSEPYRSEAGALLKEWSSISMRRDTWIQVQRNILLTGG